MISRYRLESRIVWGIIKPLLLLALPIFLGGIATYFELTSATLTSHDLLLINALQFVSTIWFGWASSQIVSEHSFQERQKRFALSAYRRIKEIEYSVDRIIGRIRVKSASGSPATTELDTIREMVLGLRATTRSSKADWADIIGEEITTLEKIEDIEESKSDQPMERIDERQDTRELQHLLASLPKSLEIQAQQLNPKDRLWDEITLLQDELKSTGYIDLNGFWDSSFEMDIFSLPVGCTLLISPDDVGGRVHALIAHTEDGRSVGVITNSSHRPLKYYEFVEAFIMAMNTSRCTGKYLEKSETYRSGRPRRNEEGRHYFKVRVSAQGESGESPATKP